MVNLKETVRVDHPIQLEVEGKIVIPSLWLYIHAISNNLVALNPKRTLLSQKLCRSMAHDYKYIGKSIGFSDALEIIPSLLVCDILGDKSWTGYFHASDVPRTVMLLKRGTLHYTTCTTYGYAPDQRDLVSLVPHSAEEAENLRALEEFWEVTGFSIKNYVVSINNGEM